MKILTKTELFLAILAMAAVLYIIMPFIPVNSPPATGKIALATLDQNGSLPILTKNSVNPLASAMGI